MKRDQNYLDVKNKQSHGFILVHDFVFYLLKIQLS